MSTETKRIPHEIEWIDYDVVIPSFDGISIRERRTVKIPIYRDAVTGEEMLTEEAACLIDTTKARYMGLLLPAEIRELRNRMELTQAEFSSILGLGAKTLSRWEAGRERPSQSLNLFLKVIKAKAITADELLYLRESEPDWTKVVEVEFSMDRSPYRFEIAVEEPASCVEATAA